MSGRKPRRVRWHPMADTMGIVKGIVAKPSSEDREHLLQMLSEPIKALREGVATELQWSIAAGAVALSQAIEAQGVVRGLTEHLASADAALQAIYNRAMATATWKPTALYYQELDALQTFAELYSFQISQLSRGEISQASHLAQRQAAKQGHKATVTKTPTEPQLTGVPA